MVLLGLTGALVLTSCHLIGVPDQPSGSAPTTSGRTPVYTPTPSTTTTTPTQCSAGANTERVDFGSFPSAICLDVGSTLTVSTGQGWSGVNSTDNSVLQQLSGSTSPNGATDTFKAIAAGTASLQAGWNPPVGSEVTSVSWDQMVSVKQNS